MDNVTSSLAPMMDLQVFPMNDTNISYLQATAEELLARVAELEGSHGTFMDNFETTLNTLWIFSCGVEICAMQLGFAMLEGGFVREENVVATFMKNIVDFLISIFAATMGSYNLAYPDAGVYMPRVTAAPQHHEVRTSHFFHLLFQGTAATIVSGAMAERVTIGGYMIFSLFLSGLIYPLAVRITWGGGYLSQLDEPFHDFAGSGVVHLIGGAAALAGTVVVGPRTGRWDPNLAHKWVPHDISMVMSGMLILWCGWYGFNAGSSLSLHDLESAGIVSTAFVSTTTAAASGGITIVLLSLARTRGQSIDALQLVNGVLGGLVGITAGCDVISGWHGLIVGMLAALLCIVFTAAMEKLQIDDVCDACGVHGACGYWGLLAVGLFHGEKGLLITGEWDLLRTQAWGGLLLFGIAIGLAVPFLSILHCVDGLRIDQVEEALGLDARLGFRAYVRSSEQAREFRDIASVLETCDHTPEQAIEALASLKRATLLTLTPQAPDSKLDKELDAIVHNLRTDDLSNEIWEFFAFASHHKKDGGEVARLFIEALKSKLRRDDVMQPVLERFEETNLIFLDSNNLLDLASLLPRVEKTMNLVVLLTRKVLKRPWCIAEITRAHQCGRKIILVLVEWPEKRHDPRSFRMPHDLEGAIKDLRAFVKTRRSRQSLAMARASIANKATAITQKTGTRWGAKRRGSLGSDKSDDAAMRTTSGASGTANRTISREETGSRRPSSEKQPGSERPSSEKPAGSQLPSSERQARSERPSAEKQEDGRHQPKRAEAQPKEAQKPAAREVGNEALDGGLKGNFTLLMML